MSIQNKQAGEICPECIEKRRSGVLVLKQGKFGKFLGCSHFPKCFYTTSLHSKNLENIATNLINKGKNERRPVFKQKNRHTRKERALMKMQRKQRGEMFRDFNRLIAE